VVEEVEVVVTGDADPQAATRRANSVAGPPRRHVAPAPRREAESAGNEEIGG
jgi:hypothetical protein